MGHPHQVFLRCDKKILLKSQYDVFGININQQALVIQSLQIYWEVQNDKISALDASKMQKLIAI